MTKIKKVYIVYKHSVYQKYVLVEKNKRLIQLIKRRHPTTLQLLPTHQKHLKAIEHIKQTLTDMGIKFTLSARSHLKPIKDYDLIVTVGGDGTFFRTCHYVKDQPVVGVNSVPELSVGAMCSIDVDSFAQRMRDIVAGCHEVRPLHRISIILNKKRFPIEPINDVLFTNFSPAATSRYLIGFHGISEEHKSSGVWIATASGSTAAIHAAGGTSQPGHDNRLQFLTREPYQGIYNPYHLTKGFVEKNETLTLTSKMIKGRLFLDGPTQIVPVDYGDEITLSLSQNVLNMIV